MIWPWQRKQVRHEELMEMLADIRTLLFEMLPEELPEGEPACEHPDEPGKRMNKHTMGHHEWWCLVCGHHEKDGVVIDEKRES